MKKSFGQVDVRKICLGSDFLFILQTIRTLFLFWGEIQTQKLQEKNEKSDICQNSEKNYLFFFSLGKKYCLFYTFFVPP